MKKIILSASIALTIAVAFTLQTARPTVASSISLDSTIAIQTHNLGIVNTTLPTLQPFPTFPSFNSDFFLPEKTPRINPRRTATPQPTVEVTNSPNPTATAVATNKPSSTPTQTPTIKPTATVAPTLEPTKTATPKPTQAPSTNTSYTDQVIQLVNNERSKAGLPALTKNNNLTDSAQKYAAYMASANFFSHTGLDGSTFSSRIKASGYTNYRWIGENIAAGQRTPQEVMNGWMNSSGHKANILNVNAKEIGVGYATNNSSTYKTYWVQNFGSK